MTHRHYLSYWWRVRYWYRVEERAFFTESEPATLADAREACERWAGSGPDRWAELFVARSIHSEGATDADDLTIVGAWKGLPGGHVRHDDLDPSKLAMLAYRIRDEQSA